MTPEQGGNAIDDSRCIDPAAELDGCTGYECGHSHLPLELLHDVQKAVVDIRVVMELVLRASAVSRLGWIG